jgi:hypothetical protein
MHHIKANIMAGVGVFCADVAEADDEEFLKSGLEV